MTNKLEAFLYPIHEKLAPDRCLFEPYLSLTIEYKPQNILPPILTPGTSGTVYPPNFPDRHNILPRYYHVMQVTPCNLT